MEADDISTARMDSRGSCAAGNESDSQDDDDNNGSHS